MNIIKTKLSQILKNTIKELYNIEIEEIKLENPPKKELGDFCFGPFLLAKSVWKNPAIISNELKDYFLSPDFTLKMGQNYNLNSNYNSLDKSGLFEDVSVAGPYLNFKLSFSFYSELFKNYKLSIPNIWNWKKIVVDYIGMNVWKPMHIWHMCTPNQGQITCNLFRILGFEVIWDSHLWDWWIIFGKLILAYKMWWNEEKLKENAVNYLLELYIKITQETEKNLDLEEQTRQEFKKLSEGNKESIDLWQKFTSYSISAMQIQLDRLNVKPDFDIWESFYEGLWLPKMWNYPDLKYKMSDIVDELVQKNIATKNEDWSVWVIFDEKTKIPSCILQKRDGTHGYLASDLAAIKYRMTNWNPEKIIYHVDVRQELHFKQAFEISKNAWWLNPPVINDIPLIKWELKGDCKLFFAWNGFISLKDGAMSSRKWNIIKLEDLLDEAVERAKKILKEKREDLDELDINEISEIIWIWAIKYWYLSKSRTTDMIFDWDEFMTFEWNSFPYVAYSYVRALRILEKSWISLEEINSLKINENFSNPEQVLLFKEISALNEILISVSENITHHNLVIYAYNLAKSFSAFYNSVNILWEENMQKKMLNLKLINSYIETQKLVFEVLAIKLPTKM